MGFIGGRVGYGLLTRIAPREESSGCLNGTAYLNQSKLEVLLGSAFFEEIQGKTVLDFGCAVSSQRVATTRPSRRGRGR